MPPPPSYKPATVPPAPPSPKPSTTPSSVGEVKRPDLGKTRNPNSWSPSELQVKTVVPVKKPPAPVAPPVESPEESTEPTQTDAGSATTSPAPATVASSSDRHTGKYTEDQYIAAIAAFRREKRLNATFLERELKVTLSAALAIIERMGDELAGG